MEKINFEAKKMLPPNEVLELSRALVSKFSQKNQERWINTISTADLACQNFLKLYGIKYEGVTITITDSLVDPQYILDDHSLIYVSIPQRYLTSSNDQEYYRIYLIRMLVHELLHCTLQSNMHVFNPKNQRGFLQSGTKFYKQIEEEFILLGNTLSILEESVDFLACLLASTTTDQKIDLDIFHQQMQLGYNLDSLYKIYSYCQQKKCADKFLEALVFSLQKRTVSSIIIFFRKKFNLKITSKDFTDKGWLLPQLLLRDSAN